MLVLELALIGFILITAGLVAVFRDPIIATAVFAAFSLAMALVWILLASPDVALTEAAIGAGVMVILLLIAAVGTSGDGLMPSLEDRLPFRPINVRALIVVGGFTMVLAYSVLSFPNVGDPESPSVRQTDPTGAPSPYVHYLGETTAELGVSNAVAAVLFVYRNLDTFGEIIVVFAALISVLIVLDRSFLSVGERANTTSKSEDSVDYFAPDLMSPVGMISVRLVIPLVFVFGVYLTIHGATLPGGGFPGGVVIGAVFVLMMLVFGHEPTVQWSNETVLAWAIVLAIGSFILFGVGGHLLSGAMFDVGVYPIPPILVIEAIEVAIGVLVGAIITVLVFVMAFGIKAANHDGQPDEEHQR